MGSRWTAPARDQRDSAVTIPPGFLEDVDETRILGKLGAVNRATRDVMPIPWPIPACFSIDREQHFAGQHNAPLRAMLMRRGPGARRKLQKDDLVVGAL